MVPPVPDARDNDARDLIAADLNRLIDDAIGAFRRMAGVAIPLETKGIAAYLRATNALLDHIDGLVRLNDWATTGPTTNARGRAPRRPDAPSDDDRGALVAAARQALGRTSTERP